MKDKKLQFLSSEVLISTPDTKVPIHRGVRAGQYRKLASRVYTTNQKDSLEQIVLRNLWQIVAYFFPDGLITDRTAFEFKPSSDGMIYVISARVRDISLPGPLTVKPRKGVPALSSDKSFIAGLKVCSPARAFLENLQPSRVGSTKRTLSIHEIEEKLDSLLRANPENGLRELRENALSVASQLKMQQAYQKLDLLMGGLLGTKEVAFSSHRAQARKHGHPYDPRRVELFQNLMTHLLASPPVSRLSKNTQMPAWKNISFFEAYFSNFIEGTEFDIKEASDIIFGGKVPMDRPEDAHDILGTYQLVSSLQEMSITPNTYEDCEALLKKRHRSLMSSRPAVTPGDFKKRSNRAGATYFVDPDLVLGTLKIGFDFYKALDVPFHRAVFMQFLISEVHPFNDGNGRLSRVMMNAELMSKGEERIIITNVFRGNYLSALSALSIHGIPDPLVRTLDFAQKYVALMPWKNFDQVLDRLKETNAFLDSAKAETEGIRLRLPDM